MMILSDSSILAHLPVYYEQITVCTFQSLTVGSIILPDSNILGLRLYLHACGL